MTETPQQIITRTNIIYDTMTLRDYFAGQALVGLIARSGPGRLPEDEQLAGMAYYIATAMLDAREPDE